MQTSKLYYSREDRISEIHDSRDRIQYDGRDGERIVEATDTYGDYSDQLFDAVDRLLDSEDDRDLEVNRCNLIERWALAQAALSKLAWVIRVDGNVAYERMVNALKDGSAADMRGL